MFIAGLPPATHQLVMSFTEQLVKDGLLTRILTLLGVVNEGAELAALERGRALGDAHHRRQVVEMIRDQRACLTDCLLLWVVQTPPTRDHTLQLIKHLKTTEIDGWKSDAKTDDGGQSSPDVSTATIDMATVSLCVTIMSCFNIGEGALDPSDDSWSNDQFPILSDPTFLPSVHAELTNVSYGGEDPLVGELICRCHALPGR